MKTNTTTRTIDGLSYTGTLVGDVLIVSLETSSAQQQTVVLLNRDAKSAHVTSQTRSRDFDGVVSPHEQAMSAAVMQMAKDLHSEGIQYLHGPEADPKLVKITLQPDGGVMLEEVVDGVINNTAKISADGLSVKEFSNIED